MKRDIGKVQKAWDELEEYYRGQGKLDEFVRVLERQVDSGTESDEASPRTCGPTTAIAPGDAAMVARSDGVPSGWPHVRQNRLSVGTTAAQDGQCMWERRALYRGDARWRT